MDSYSIIEDTRFLFLLENKIREVQLDFLQPFQAQFLEMRNQDQLLQE